MTLIKLVILALLSLSINCVGNERLTGSVLPKVSVQLWSVKDELKADFKGTITHLAQLGFQGVEFAGYFGEFDNDAKGLNKFLNTLGLEASGAHLGFDKLNEKNFDKTVDFYKAVGVKFLIVPWDDRAWHPEGIKAVVNDLNVLAEKISVHDMKVGFHNHDQEFNSYQKSTYWDYLATHTRSDVVLQLDVGWVTYAGENPIDYVERYPGRTITTHYKVKLPPGTYGKIPIIGQDTINWLKLIKSNITYGKTEWLVVEQEEYPNNLTPLQAVEKSKKGLDKYLKQFYSTF